MEGDGELLENLAYEFFKSKIHLNLSGINPVNIENLEKYVSVINYFLEKKYIIERGTTVKDFNYCATENGLNWFDTLKRLKSP